MGYGDHRTFEAVSRVNLERALVWHPGGLQEWSPAEWGNAAAGEMGELCNVLKKILRVEGGIQQANNLDKNTLRQMAAQEIGDTFLYLNLIAQRLGLDMYECIADTFNRVSEREGFEQRLGK
jgi:NTP pyrophosphatase (non-canonical NTP hydrolase)